MTTQVQKPLPKALPPPGAEQKPAVKSNPTLREYLEERASHLAELAGGMIEAKKLIKTALLAERRNSKLAECSLPSVFESLLALAEAGLEPDGVEAALVPYSGTCQAQAMYQGIVKILYSSGMVKDVSAKIVYSNEVSGGRFKYEDGSEPWVKHEPLISNRGVPIAAYAIIRLMTGGHIQDVMSKDDVELIRVGSKGAAKPDSPWNKHPLEMWKKTVFRRISKFAPKSDKLRAALAIYGEPEEREAIETTATEVKSGNDGLESIARAALGEGAIKETIPEAPAVETTATRAEPTAEEIAEIRAAEAAEARGGKA